MSTPAKVQEWLRNNDGNLSDAYRAVKYEGPPLKIKEGSLSTNRSSIRVSVRGDNGDTRRSQNRRLRPPQSKDEENRNRRQNYKARDLRRQGKKVHVDHKIDLKLLGQTVEGMSPEEATSHIEKLEQSYGPLGNRPDNRQIIGDRTNLKKAAQSAELQRFLEWMDNGNNRLNDIMMGRSPRPRLPVKYGANMAVEYGDAVLEIADRFTDGKASETINGALNSAVDFVKDNGTKLVDGLVDTYVALNPSVSDSNTNYGQ